MQEELVLAVVIFFLRVMNYSIGTVRLVAITRNRRFLAAMLAAVEAFVFAVTIANVVTDLENAFNLISYCAGASVGSYVGMLIEARYVTGYSIVNVITPSHGHDIAVSLRNAGFGVTESAGEGRDGTVTHLRCVIDKREIPHITRMIREIQPSAFITVEEARAVSRGWVGGPVPGRDRG